jgi:hypothetical protein
MRDIDEYMATPGLGGEDDATDYAEFDAGYGDAPGWYWASSSGSALRRSALCCSPDG